MNRTEKYVVVSPIRDEAKYIEKTIFSMISQTVIPLEWIIVDDGSQDNTGDIIDAYADKYEWIKIIHRKDRGFRQSGGGVVEAFCAGYNILTYDDWDFIVKLDGDLSFGEDYFERCFQYFQNDPKLGISGGGIYNIIDGKTILEEDPPFHVRGATKIYRKACWNNIGGLFKVPGWDTLDELKANMLGWKTKGYAEIEVIHLRPTGDAYGVWRDWAKNGLANYISGYHPLFMLIKCVKRMFQKPYILIAVGLFYGFVSGYIKKIPQIDDRALIRYIRKEQMNKLLLKPSIWK